MLGMNIYYQTPAIVLAARDEREADRVFTFYTRDFGKIKTLARGIRFMKSKLRGHIVLGALLRIAFVEGKESYHLVDAEILYNPLGSPYFKGGTVINSALKLRGVGRFTDMHALQFFERVIGERERDEELWQFLLGWLLDKKGDMVAFQARVLSLLGFLPRDTAPSFQLIQSALVANHLA